MTLFQGNVVSKLQLDSEGQTFLAYKNIVSPDFRPLFLAYQIFGPLTNGLNQFRELLRKLAYPSSQRLREHTFSPISSRNRLSMFIKIAG